MDATQCDSWCLPKSTSATYVYCGSSLTRSMKAREITSGNIRTILNQPTEPYSSQFTALQSLFVTSAANRKFVVVCTSNSFLSAYQSFYNHRALIWARILSCGNVWYSFKALTYCISWALVIAGFRNAVSSSSSRHSRSIKHIKAEVIIFTTARWAICLRVKFVLS
jgi:hypothetical protein